MVMPAKEQRPGLRSTGQRDSQHVRVGDRAQAAYRPGSGAAKMEYRFSK